MAITEYSRESYEIHLEGGIGVLANLITNDLEYKTQLQHTMCNQE